MQTTERVLAAALTQGLSHGAFRLYVILDGASREAGVENEYFPVTLEGLMRLHPGTGGREVGATTVIKQVSALRKIGLLDIRAAIHRTEPRKPVLVKVVDPPKGPTRVAGVANTQ